MIHLGTHPSMPGKILWREVETHRTGVLWENTPADVRRDAVERGLLPYSRF